MELWIAYPYGALNTKGYHAPNTKPLGIMVADAAIQVVKYNS